DRKSRLLQEVVVGKCVPKLLDKIGLKIDLLHMNEAHTVTAACYIKEMKKYSSIPILFTTHTPVPAGMEIYPVEWFDLLELPEKYLDLFRPKPSSNILDFTLAALKLSSLTNGVSLEHAEVTKNMFLEHRKKIIGITNGSSRYWQAPELRDPDSVTPEKLWDVHLKYKKEALEDASNRLKNILNEEIIFDINKPSVGLFRRIVDYKQQYPMLCDIIEAVCAPLGEKVMTPMGELNGLGMQVFIAGYAHPTDAERQEWVSRFIKWTISENLRGRFAFLPGYGEVLLRHGARGYDIWINCPIKDMEACGTSDQRSALNGNINIFTYTGGPREYIEEIDEDKATGCGFVIDPYSPGTLYRKLEKASQLWYSCINGDSDTYKKIMFNSYKAGMTMTIENMALKYARDLYLPALEMTE
ncbi:MAG: glycogen/starch synthase, partial [Elusimicrobiota bacterium]